MLQTASIIGFLRTILIFVLVYTIFKYLMRLFAPYIVKSIAKKAEAHFRNQSAPKPPTQKEGEISIDKIPNSKTSNKDVGEYVDYEEVE
ncbi:DUF4834 family protein [Flavobacteriaceae bacterium]|jgi:hypothetical protein|nr:DUF4834 family protein [Flavobacteriaceae bacterium]